MLLARWGLPERVSRIVAEQRLPEFMAPAVLEPERRTTLVALYLARLCAAELEGAESVSTAYVDDHLGVLGITATYDAFFRETLLPGLRRHPKRLPRPIQELLQIRDE